MKRVQRTRKKGGGMPPGSKYVGRGSRWGNPYKVSPGTTSRSRQLDIWLVTTPIGVLPFGGKQQAAAASIALYESMMRANFPKTDDMRAFLGPLRGYDLACWCGPEDACHVDIILKLIREIWP